MTTVTVIFSTWVWRVRASQSIGPTHSWSWMASPSRLMCFPRIMLWHHSKRSASVKWRAILESSSKRGTDRWTAISDSGIGTTLPIIICRSWHPYSSSSSQASSRMSSRRRQIWWTHYSLTTLWIWKDTQNAKKGSKPSRTKHRCSMGVLVDLQVTLLTSNI